MDEDAGVSSDLRDRMDDHRRSTADGGTLVVSPQEGYVGESVTLKGRNLQPDRGYEVVWHSTDGQWGVLEAHEIVGPQYRPRTETVATVETDDAGSFDETWTVPEDYGGAHRLELRQAGEAVAETELEIVPARSS